MSSSPTTRGRYWQRLSSLVSETRSPAEMAVHAPQVAVAGTSIAPLVIGRLLRDAEVRRADLVLECEIACTYDDTEWRPDADGNRHPTTVERTSVDRLRVGARDFLPPGRLRSRHSFSKVTELAVPGHAIGSIDTSNVRVSWQLVAELHVPGRNAKASAPLHIVGLHSPVLNRAPVTKAEGAATVQLLDVAESTFLPGDRVQGTLLVTPSVDFAASAVTVDLIMQSTTRISGDQTSATTYGGLSAGSTHFRSGQPVRFPFSVVVPDPLPGPSISHPKFEVSWYLKGRVHRRFRRDPTVTIDLDVGRASDRHGFLLPAGTGA
jgi:hypothetical protein